MAIKQSSVRYRRIKGHSDYKVGDDGSFWSRRKWKNWTRVKGSPNHDGYLRTSITSDDGHTRLKFIHVMVLEAFVGPCPEGMESRHLNGIANDNRLDNLKWGTPTENTEDKRRHGSFDEMNKGESNGWAKANDEVVRKIRTMYATGNFSQQEISNEVNIHQTTVSKIIRRQTWSHVT